MLCFYYPLFFPLSLFFSAFFLSSFYFPSLLQQRNPLLLGKNRVTAVSRDPVAIEMPAAAVEEDQGIGVKVIATVIAVILHILQTRGIVNSPQMPTEIVVTHRKTRDKPHANNRLPASSDQKHSYQTHEMHATFYPAPDPKRERHTDFSAPNSFLMTPSCGLLNQKRDKRMLQQRNQKIPETRPDT